MSFSPFFFCWKFGYFQSKRRVARYKATIPDDTNNKKEGYKEVFQNPIAFIFICLWPHFEASQ